MWQGHGQFWECCSGCLNNMYCSWGTPSPKKMLSLPIWHLKMPQGWVPLQRTLQICQSFFGKKTLASYQWAPGTEAGWREDFCFEVEAGPGGTRFFGRLVDNGRYAKWCNSTPWCYPSDCQGEARRRRVEARKSQGTEKKWNFSGKSSLAHGEGLMVIWLRFKMTKSIGVKIMTQCDQCGMSLWDFDSHQRVHGIFSDGNLGWCLFLSKVTTASSMTASDARRNDASCFQFSVHSIIDLDSWMQGNGQIPWFFGTSFSLFSLSLCAAYTSSIQTSAQENMRPSWNASACWPFAHAAASVLKMKVGDIWKEGIALMREVP